MKPPSKFLNNGSPLPRLSSVWMQSVNIPSEPPYPNQSEMHPPEWPYTSVTEIVAVADEVADPDLDEATDARSTIAYTVNWTIIPPKNVQRESTLNTTQTPAVQTPAVQTSAVQTTPGMRNVFVTTAVSQDTSSPTASPSNMPVINTTKSTMAQHPHRMLQQEIVT